MYKKHSSFSFIALLFKPRLSEHEQSGAIGMLKAGVCFLRRQISLLPFVNYTAPQKSLPGYWDS